MLIVKNEMGERERPVAGMVNAVCAFVEDIGIQTVEYQNQKKNQHKVVICWELEQTLKAGKYAGKPFMVSKRYTFTLYEQGNLSKDLESWFSKKMPPETRAQGFDLDTLIGKKCTLALMQHDSGAIVVNAVLPPMPNNQVVKVCEQPPEWIQKERDKAIDPATTGFNQDTSREPPPEDVFGMCNREPGEDVMPWETGK